MRRLGFLLITFHLLILPVLHAANLAAGQPVLVSAGNGKTYPASILEIKASKAKVRYTGYGADKDEWMDLAYLAADPNAQSSAPAAAPAAGAADVTALSKSGDDKFAADDFVGALADFHQALTAAKQQYGGLPFSDNNRSWLPSLNVSIGKCLLRLDRNREAAEALETAAADFAKCTGADPAAAKKATAQAYDSAAWARLLSNDPQDAAGDSMEAYQLDNQDVGIALNFAHGMLLTGAAPAEATYRSHMGQKLADGRTFEEAAMKDFSDMEAHGVNSPEFARMEIILRGTPAPSVGSALGQSMGQ